jgi:hypothetical protein
MENKSTFFKTNKKTSPTQKKRFHRISWFLASLIFIALFVLLIIYYAPQSSVTIANFHVTCLVFFFILLFCALFSLTTVISKSKKHGFLIGLFTVIYLLFRLNHLTHPFFLILLLALFFVLELMVSNRNGVK